MVSLTFKICTAYEQGFGKGIDAAHAENPYNNPPDGIEAWVIGYDELRWKRLLN